MMESLPHKETETPHHGKTSSVRNRLAAVGSAIQRTARVVLEDHIESCLRQAVENGTMEKEWHDLKTALDRYIR